MGIKIKSLFFALFFCLCFSFCVQAVDTADKVYDDASLLSDEEKQQLHDTACRIAQESSMDVVVLTTMSANGQSARQYGESFYLRHGFGFGTQKSGVMLVMNMNHNRVGQREIEIIAFGDTCDVLTLKRLDRILDSGTLIKGLQNEAYFDVISFVLDECGDYAQHPWRRARDYIPVFAVISLFVGVIFFIIVYTKSKNPVLRRVQIYADASSLALSKQRNDYVRTSVVRTPINSNSSGSRASGHSSSSGSVRSHSSGRRF
ncbi:MAG: TPM domain-containing protein [Clostridiales bacterium]|nr:TPM domain-containing protein [Clostridiales bacterium]